MSDKSTRQLGPELARIIGMAAIIAGHFRFQNDITGGYLVNFLSSAPNIAVNLFLMTGVWFMTEKNFDPSRPLKIHAALIFYGWSITAIVTACTGSCLQHILQGIFPFFGSALWFASAYICLQFLSPYLANLNQLRKSSASFMCLAIPAVISTIASMPWDSEGGILSGLTWFVCIYLIISYLKRHTRFFETANPRPFFFGSILLYCAMIATLTFTGPTSMIHVTTAHWRSTIQSAPNALIAFGLFVGLRSIRGSCPRFLQAISTSTFGIYVIHQMPCFINVQWKLIKKFVPLPLIGEINIATDICFVVLTLFTVYTVVDRLRARLFEPRMLSGRLAQKIRLTLQNYG